ncbi:MAG TPA: STAS domain-containing protein [Solirubrobacteraceae bacterium]|nr:STAS domain-containing protein [Solirubrobacteraceae bacterium]
MIGKGRNRHAQYTVLTPARGQMRLLRSDLPPAAVAAAEPTFCLSESRRVVDPAGREVVLMTIRGDVDLATESALRQALQPLIDRGTGQLAVDLTDVDFMDSTGVHLLVDANRRLSSQHRRLTIACREHGAVHRLLDLVGLLDLLSVYRSSDSAVAGGHEMLRSEPGRYQTGCGSSDRSHLSAVAR